mmetsp:Transcript_20318/g.65969  ORF Transcript_20318/g.65969 Transcript_20318/m.65969 type:complete len:252 (-) Transcript_20318:7-762(-)
MSIAMTWLHVRANWMALPPTPVKASMITSDWQRRAMWRAIAWGVTENHPSRSRRTPLSKDLKRWYRCFQYLCVSRLRPSHCSWHAPRHASKRQATAGATAELRASSAGASLAAGGHTAAAAARTQAVWPPLSGGGGGGSGHSRSQGRSNSTASTSVARTVAHGYVPMGVSSCRTCSMLCAASTAAIAPRESVLSRMRSVTSWPAALHQKSRMRRRSSYATEGVVSSCSIGRCCGGNVHREACEAWHWERRP